MTAIGATDFKNGERSSTLELKNVRKTYRSGDEEVVALDHASLTVGDDELITLVGPSGSGKSTLISISGGLLTPTEGAVVVGDEDISDYSPKRLTRFRSERVGFVFQTVNLVPFLTARGGLLVAAEADRHTPRAANAPTPAPTNSSMSSASVTAAAISRPSSRAANANELRSVTR